MGLFYGSQLVLCKPEIPQIPMRMTWGWEVEKTTTVMRWKLCLYECLIATVDLDLTWLDLKFIPHLNTACTAPACICLLKNPVKTTRWKLSRQLCFLNPCNMWKIQQSREAEATGGLFINRKYVCAAYWRPKQWLIINYGCTLKNKSLCLWIQDEKRPKTFIN